MRGPSDEGGVLDREEIGGSGRIGTSPALSRDWELDEDPMSVKGC